MVFASDLLSELGDQCQVDTTRDWLTVERRVEHEGLSFLTITLSDFGKSFEKSLALGHLSSTSFDSSWKIRSGVPQFLGGFLGLVFDLQTGSLLNEPNVSALRAIRQFSLAFGKIGVDCSDERKTRALNGYIRCEQELRQSDRSFHGNLGVEFDRMARRLWSNLLARVNHRLYVGDFRPKHGPGTTADGLIGNQKFTNRVWTERLEREFPFIENGLASYSQYDELDSVDFLEPGTEIPCEVIMVPKTLKTPRIIAREPTHMQYMQQAIHELFKEEIRADYYGRTFVCYDSQVPNQELAREGSLMGDLATLDLSEASDRVSNEHVRTLLSHNKYLHDGVDACRSRTASIVDKSLGFDTKIRLAKFASMGSALCFPIESIVFATIVFLGIEKSLGHQLSAKDIKSFAGRVRVYGDDIIVPVDYALTVVETLEAYGYKVNHSKSFWTGRFRESCGKDYYGGVDVSIHRVRHMFPSNQKDGSKLASIVALRNHFAADGYSKVVNGLDDFIKKIIPFPKVLAGSPVLGRVDLDGVYDVHKIDRNLQRPLVRGVVVSTRSPINKIDGWDGVLKHFLKRGRDPFMDVEHAIHSGRSLTVDTEFRDASPY